MFSIIDIINIIMNQKLSSRNIGSETKRERETGMKFL